MANGQRVGYIRVSSVGQNPARQLAELLPERTSPELAYLQARFAALVSYGITADLLSELLPLGRRLHPAVVRRAVHAVADKLEGELGEEQPSFIDTCQRDREELPRPDLPIIVGLDGGYVHSSQQRSRADGWFEVIAGKTIPAAGRPSCFGYVQTYADGKIRSLACCRPRGRFTSSIGHSATRPVIWWISALCSSGSATARASRRSRTTASVNPGPPPSPESRDQQRKR